MTGDDRTDRERLPVGVQGRLYYPGGRIGGLEPVRLPGERVGRGAA